MSSVLDMYSSNPKLYPSIKCKRKSSTAKVLNVDTFLYCKPNCFLPRNIALGLDPIQIDTPCVHVVKLKLYPSIECKNKSSTAKVLNVDTFLYCKPNGFFREILRLFLILCK